MANQRGDLRKEWNLWEFVEVKSSEIVLFKTNCQNMCNIQSYGKQLDTRKSTWTRIKVVHAAQQIISISIVGTVVIFDFKTLKSVSFQLIILLYVFFSFTRSTDLYFDQEWGEKKKKTPWWFRERSDKIFSYLSLGLWSTQVDFNTLKPFFFQLKILTHISSSFVRSTRAYWIEDGTKRMKKQARLF